VGHVARMGRGEVFTGFGREARRGEEITEKTWMITLRWASGRQGSMGRNGFVWLRIGSVGRLL
jgi:hypothetical protein